jgi:hypothetical protein
MKREQETFPYIAHLLNGAEVEWKPLGEVCDKIFAGGTPASTKEEYYNGTIPWLRSGEINFNGIDKTEKTITELGFSKSSARWVRKNSVLLAMTGATVARSAVNNIELTANQSVCALETNESIINYKYLYYCLANKYEALKNQGQGVLSSLNLTTIKKIEIPVPPLSVQQEIVRILDKFTQLEAELKIELETELDCRKRQYEYYRDKLLAFNEVGGGSRALIFSDLQWKTLGEVLLSVKTGLNPRRFFKLNTSDAKNYYITIRELRDGKIIPSDKTDRINDDALNLCQKRSNLEIGDVLFSGTGTIGEMAIIKEEPYNWNIKEGVYALKPNHIIITSGYIRYILSSQKIKDKIISKSAGGTVKSISMKELQLIQIPVPPIEEQERIAGILDKFDTLVNSISEGLPREIELRRKQYEYYREKLLSFPKN